MLPLPGLGSSIIWFRDKVLNQTFPFLVALVYKAAATACIGFIPHPAEPLGQTLRGDPLSEVCARKIIKAAAPLIADYVALSVGRPRQPEFSPPSFTGLNFNPLVGFKGTGHAKVRASAPALLPHGRHTSRVLQGAHAVRQR